MCFANKRYCKHRDGYQGRITRQSPRAPLFQRYCVLPLRALHHCLVKKVMYHSGATFKEALKQVMFFKINQNLWENVP